MRVPPIVSACALAALVALPGAAHALSPAEVFQKVSPSVWRIRTYDREGVPLAQGSAVVIAPETLVTNCHVLGKADRFVVVREKVSYAGKLELWDPERDVCQVKAAGLGAPAVRLGDASAVFVGQNVFALGNPLGLELTLSAGLVSSLRRDAAQRIVAIQISAPISHGSSGGGLFDEQARLIGVTSSGMQDGQNLNFALPVNWITELPQRHATREAALPVDTTRFDGNWKVAVACPALSNGVAAYRFEFPAQVTNSNLRGRYGEEGRASSMLLEGTIASDGRSTLSATGLTGDARYNFDHAQPMARYTYHVNAHFDATYGSGQRVESRQCELTFAKQ